MTQILDLKWKNSRKSLTELGKLLSCDSCSKLANTPHVSDICYHIFCLSCVKDNFGGKCPVCQKPIDSKSCKLNLTVESFIQAYKEIVTLIGLSEHEETSSIQNQSSITVHNESLNGKENSSQPSIVPQPLSSFQTPLSKKKRSTSPNESLNSSMNITTPGPKIDKRNKKGETALQVACVKGDLLKAKDLLQQGANPNTQDNAGWTPLHEAVCGGIEDLVQVLLLHGANPNIPGGPGQNQTPLHDAAFLNKSSIVKLLLAHGADVNARNADGKTPKEICSDETLSATLDGFTTSSVCTVAALPVPVQLTGRTIVVYGLNLEKKTMQHYSKLGRVLGVKVVNSYSSKVTHVLVQADDPRAKLNINFFSAVLLGQWIVDHNWIADCGKENCLIDPCKYELTGALCKAPIEGSPSRLNAMHQLPGLLNNCRFYLNGQFESPSRADLTSWIKNGGGTILTRMPNPETIATDQSIPYHADPAGKLSHCSHFVLYDPCAKTQPSILYNMNHIKTLPVQWFLTCIEHFALVDPFL